MKKINFILALCSTSLFTANVNAQELTSFQGFWAQEYYQDDEKLSKSEFKSLLYTNNEATAYWKKSETNATVGYLAFIGQIGFTVWTASELAEDDGDALVPALGTIRFRLDWKFLLVSIK